MNWVSILIWLIMLGEKNNEDCFLGDTVFIGRYEIKHNDFDKIVERFKEIKPHLEQCDYIVFNLETQLTT